MSSKIPAMLVVLALTAIGLPIRVQCQQPGPVVRMMPFARSATKDMRSNSLPDLIHTLRQIPPAADEDCDGALKAIVRLGPAARPALPDVLRFITNQNPRLKIQAIFALTAIRPDTESVSAVVPVLIQALGDEEWTMRAAAINALFALRPPPPDAAAAVVPLLDDSEEYVRRAAMSQLVAQTNPIVIPTLDKWLHDKNSYVVTEAACQIGAFGNAAAASEPRLKELQDAPVLSVRQAASNALAAISGQPIPHPAHDPKADNTFNFPGIPLEQFLDYYEGLAGRKVKMAASPDPGAILHVQTAQPLTKSEALLCMEEVLKEQTSLIIIHGADGSLTAIATSKETQH